MKAMRGGQGERKAKFRQRVREKKKQPAEEKHKA